MCFVDVFKWKQCEFVKAFYSSAANQLEMMIWLMLVVRQFAKVCGNTESKEAGWLFFLG